MQSDGPPFNTGHDNRLCVTRSLKGLVLLHFLNELAGDIVDAHRFSLRWSNTVKEHTVTHAIGGYSGLGSDDNELPLLFGHHDLPILRVLNFHGTKVSSAHALARENALNRNRRHVVRRARSRDRCAGI